MRNPALTRETILKASGELFNTRGYKATSIRHITDATGLTKGAIYKHFENKEALERETFSFLSRMVEDTLTRDIRREKNAPAKLEVIFRYFESYLTRPLITGGCPLMNLAVEADDAHPDLRREARRMLGTLRSALVRILENGIRYGQITPETESHRVAAIILASLEGGIMMSKLEGSTRDMTYVLQHMRSLVKSHCV